jgi:hypothetical protein
VRLADYLYVVVTAAVAEAKQVRMWRGELLHPAAPQIRHLLEEPDDKRAKSDR